MGRPPTPPGTAGDPWKNDLPDGRVEYRCNFRDYDGRTRQIRRIGATGRAAKAALREAVRDRKDAQGVTVRADLKISALADLWLKQVTANPKMSIGTKQHYANVVKLYVTPALGQLRIAETTVSAIDRALLTVQTTAGPGAAKSMRSVLSGMLGYAVRHDALRANPVRDTSPMSSRPAKGRARSLTAEQVDDIRDRMRSDAQAVALDLPDFIDWMLFTGCRIGEACAAKPGLNSEQKQILDLEAGTWEVCGTVVRETGRGLIIQPRTKSDAGWRVLALPPSAVEMVRRRQNEIRWQDPSGVIFSSATKNTLRDPSNTPGDLRKMLDRFGYPWVTSHTLRKTVATRLEEAGLTPRQVADQLGHSQPSMTMDVYFGRGVVNAAAAVVLDR